MYTWLKLFITVVNVPLFTLLSSTRFFTPFIAFFTCVAPGAQAIEHLKAFEKKDQHLKAMAATNLAFIYFLEGRVLVLSDVAHHFALSRNTCSNGVGFDFAYFTCNI